MSRHELCDGCEVGDHSKHKVVVQHCPEGMLGGVICPCTGECVDDPRCTPEAFLERMLGPAAVDILTRSESPRQE